MISTLKKYRFLLSRLVRRDFIQKYKKTAFGILWSIFNPLCEFFILMIVFKNIFGRDTPHYTLYVIIGVLIYNYYTNATIQGMESLLYNASIINKIKLPTWLFPLSKNVSATVNFFITCLVMIVFMIVDHAAFTWKLILLIYPVILLFFFNLGISFILSSIYVFFKDVSYFYHIFNKLLYYCCAIFWTIDRFSDNARRFMVINPVYDFILYARTIIIDGQVPSLGLHLILLAYSVLLFGIGLIIYHCNKNKFIFYL